MFSNILISNTTLDSSGKKIYGDSASGIFVNSYLSSVSILSGLVTNVMALKSRNGIAIESSSVTITGVTFQKGNVYVSESDVNNELLGGLLFVKSTSLSISECAFSDSKA